MTRFNTPGFGVKAKLASSILRGHRSPVTHRILTGWGPRRKLIEVQGKHALRAQRRLNDRIQARKVIVLPEWEDSE